MKVAVGVLAWDYSRSSRKDEAKKVKDEAYKAAVNKRFDAFQEVCKHPWKPKIK